MAAAIVLHVIITTYPSHPGRPVRLPGVRYIFTTSKLVHIHNTYNVNIEYALHQKYQIMRKIARLKNVVYSVINVLKHFLDRQILVNDSVVYRKIIQLQ